MQIAVVGDIHGAFTNHDVETFNQSDDDVILIVGDLERIGHSPLEASSTVVSLLARLTKPTLLVPGNHDGVRTTQMVAEAIGFRRAAALLGHGHTRRLDELERRLRPVEVCGYSTHHLSFGGDLDVVACRPCSMGGQPLSFPSFTARRYNLRTIEESTSRLCQLVDQCRSEHILFLAHNGPSGLGAKPGDIWGRDFGRGQGDHGDRDLELAVAHAKRRGKKVLSVVAGHMHHKVKGGGVRPWHLERDGTHYINAARVPRIFTSLHDGKTVHHHLRLTVIHDQVEVDEILVPVDTDGL